MKKQKQAENKPLTKKQISRYLTAMLITLISSFLYAVAISVFVIPNNFLPSGVTGVSTLLAHLFPIMPVGTYLLILNIPLFIWAYRELNTRFVFFSGVCIVTQSFFLNWFTNYLPTYTADPLLACLFGGTIIGIACGLVIKNYGSFGGVDIIGVILKNRTDISIGAVNIIFNIFVVGAAAAIFGMERGMYTIVNIFIMSMVMDQVLEGLNRKRSVTVITSKGAEIAKTINQELHRGVTVLKGEGAFTHENRDVLLCVISRFELTSLKELVQEIDPHAFVTITEVTDVLGRFVQKSWLSQDGAE